MPANVSRNVAKRSLIWCVEILLEALLLGATLAILLGYDAHSFLKDSLIYASEISIMFFLTGYLLSTFIVRICWKRKEWWSYPLIACVLFLIHFEILNKGIGGAFDPADRLRILIIGASLALACTVLGNVVLRKWVSSQHAN